MHLAIHLGHEVTSCYFNLSVERLYLFDYTVCLYTIQLFLKTYCKVNLGYFPWITLLTSLSTTNVKSKVARTECPQVWDFKTNLDGGLKHVWWLNSSWRSQRHTMTWNVILMVYEWHIKSDWVSGGTVTIRSWTSFILYAAFSKTQTHHTISEKF